MYTCKYCGKQFEKQQGWSSHQCKCKLNPNRNKSMEHLQHARSCRKSLHDNIIYNCKYCGKECKGKNSLVQHEIRCKENPNRINTKGNGYGFIQYNKLCRDGIIHHPHYGKTKYTCESLMKTAVTKQQKYKSGELQGSFSGKKHSNETKEKMRNSTIEYLKTMNNFTGPRYNVSSISFIDDLNKRYNWNLQHAENGGEFRVAGYFIDGYDKELNIAFEYDEPVHYIDVDNNILTDKDIERQSIIIETLGCEFYRYNEKLNLLYKVN